MKFWLQISKGEQMRRFHAREKVPFKQFKITPDDWRNRKKWDAYEKAVCDMVDRTSTEIAPWTLVEAEDKKYARVKILKTIASASRRPRLRWPRARCRRSTRVSRRRRLRVPGGFAEDMRRRSGLIFFLRPAVRYRRERVEAPDGDFGISIGSTRRRPPERRSSRCSTASRKLRFALRAFVDGIARATRMARGDTALPWLQRRAESTPRAYHSGDHPELESQIAAIRARVSGIDAYLMPSACRWAAAFSQLARPEAGRCGARHSPRPLPSTPLDLERRHAIGRASTGFTRGIS